METEPEEPPFGGIVAYRKFKAYLDSLYIKHILTFRKVKHRRGNPSGY